MDWWWKGEDAGRKCRERRGTPLRLRFPEVATNSHASPSTMAPRALSPASSQHPPVVAVSAGPGGGSRTKVRVTGAPSPPLPVMVAVGCTSASLMMERRDGSLRSMWDRMSSAAATRPLGAHFSTVIARFIACGGRTLQSGGRRAGEGKRLAERAKKPKRWGAAITGMDEQTKGKINTKTEGRMVGLDGRVREWGRPGLGGGRDRAGRMGGMPGAGGRRLEGLQQEMRGRGVKESRKGRRGKEKRGGAARRGGGACGTVGWIWTGFEPPTGLALRHAGGSSALMMPSLVH